jgi:zinc transporter ZupT
LSLDCTDLQSGDTITPMEDKCYRLVFSQENWQSLYQVNAAGTAAIAFFTEHFPTEFENTAHYLKDPVGEDIEPVAQFPEDPAPAPAPILEEEDTPWGPVMLASIIVNFITLSGVVLAIPAISRSIKNNFVQATGIISGFAAGAILSCAFFLLLFESTHLVMAGWTKEVDVLWRWGTMILAGILLPGVIDCLAHIGGPKEDLDKETLMASFGERMRLFLGVNLGDFLHNLCDGFFIGAAFKGCGTSFGWRVATGTILHEIPQELADYVILTGPRMAMSPLKALACNFIAGLGVVVGAAIVLSIDVGNDAIGLILAFGGGTYIHIGATECMPKMYAKELSPRARIASVTAFIIGAVLIGLVLLDHEHCVPPAPPGAEPVDPHAGHDHR